MQRVMNNVISRMLNDLNVNLIYLDDVLLLGRQAELVTAKAIHFASSYLFNMSKCDTLVLYIGNLHATEHPV